MDAPMDDSTENGSCVEVAFGVALLLRQLSMETKGIPPFPRGSSH
jgi:hypothetical protein